MEKTGEHDLSLAAEVPAMTTGFTSGGGGAAEARKSLLSELIDRFNQRHGTSFTEQDVLPAFNETMAEPKVRLAAVTNDEENLGHVFEPEFENKMAEHIDTIADLGSRYFDPDRSFRSALNRSAAWRMIREQEGVVDNAA